MRTLLILLALAVIVLIGRQLLQQQRGRRTGRERSDRMVQCARCGIYIPLHEAVSQHERYYCSDAHRAEDST